MGQQQALENYVRSLAAKLKSEKQEWLGQKQIVRTTPSPSRQTSTLSLKVHTLENTLSGLTAGTTSEKHAAEDTEENMEASHKQTQPPVVKRSDNMQALVIRIGSTTLQQLESKMS